ncbi:hypothetical protein WJX73_006034 [Symbiochloris irregularis]|uniref:Treble clef zinc finger domain-containing protein n=1 Tax=Symbiochloris irregularis TaxID=706552 RepID=A0AAW1P2J5_9CHLO
MRLLSGRPTVILTSTTEPQQANHALALVHPLTFGQRFLRTVSADRLLRNREWDYSRNTVRPEDLLPQSKVKVWWGPCLNSKHGPHKARVDHKPSAGVVALRPGLCQVWAFP